MTTKNLINYYTGLILRNYFTWTIFAIYIITNILVPVLCISVVDYSNHKDIFISTNSLILSMPHFIFSIIVLAVWSIRFFLSSKTNNEDLYMYIRTIAKTKIIYIKQLTLYFSLLIACCFGLLTSVIVWVSITSDIAQTMALVFSIFLGLLLLITFYTALFSFIGIFLKSISGTIAIIMTAMFMSMFSILPLAITNNNVDTLTYDTNTNKFNYIKINDSDEKTNDIYAIEKVNSNNVNSTKNFSNKGNDAWFNFNQNISDKLYFSMSNKNLSMDDVIFLNNKNILDKYSLNTIKMSSTKNNGQILDPNKQSYFYSSIDVPIPIEQNVDDYVDNVTFLLKNIEHSMNVNFKEESLLWISLETILKNNRNWNDVLTTEQKILLTKIFGLENGYKYLYNVWNCYELSTLKNASLLSSIGNEFGNEFASLINFLYSSDYSHLNVIDNELLMSYEKIKKMFPAPYTFNEYEKAFPSDIEYIKDTLTNQVIDENNVIQHFQVLDRNGIYRNIDVSAALGEQIVDISDWDEYLSSNSTINNLSQMLQRFNSEINNELVSFHFKDNQLNNYIFSESFYFEQKNDSLSSYCYMLIMIILICILEYLVIQKINGKDVI